MAMETSEGVDTVELAAEIVSAYVSHNSLPALDLGNLIAEVHSVLTQLSGRPTETPSPETLKPAVPVKKSITNDYLICLEDGLRFKSLKRHLRTRYDMTPEQYRAKWQLAPDYPMVAPGYAKTRSQMAKSMGLGQQRRNRDEE